MTKDPDVLELLLGIPNLKEYIGDSSKDRVILYLEEGESEGDFSVKMFDISDDVNEKSLIKEIGYGVLSFLNDEDYLDSIRKSVEYDFCVNKQNRTSFPKNLGDNVIEFTPLNTKDNI